MKPRLLVIDDDFEVRKSLRMILEYEGYEVTLASSGPDGVTAVRAVRTNVAKSGASGRSRSA